MIEVVRWWWVRHAPVTAEGFCGWSDPPADLSDAPALEALRTALPEDAALVTSDLARAVQTADAIERKTWRRAAPEPALREQNFGAWEGRGYESLAEAEQAAFWGDPANAEPPGGESFAHVCARVADAVAARNAAGDRDIVAVAHAGAIRAALAAALGSDAAMALVFEVAPLSLTRIDWFVDAHAWRIGGVNVTL